MVVIQALLGVQVRCRGCRGAGIPRARMLNTLAQCAGFKSYCSTHFASKMH